MTSSSIDVPDIYWSCFFFEAVPQAKGWMEVLGPSVVHYLQGPINHIGDIVRPQPFIFDDSIQARRLWAGLRRCVIQLGWWGGWGDISEEEPPDKQMEDWRLGSEALRRKLKVGKKRQRELCINSFTHSLFLPPRSRAIMFPLPINNLQLPLWSNEPPSAEWQMRMTESIHRG